jgi:hypothetical protein
LEKDFKYEVLGRQAEASDDQELAECCRRMRYENRRRAQRAERLLAQRLYEKKLLRNKGKEERHDATEGQKP